MKIKVVGGVPRGRHKACVLACSVRIGVQGSQYEVIGARGQKLCDATGCARCVWFETQPQDEYAVQCRLQEAKGRTKDPEICLAG